jgi:hypothetical protein
LTDRCLFTRQEQCLSRISSGDGRKKNVEFGRYRLPRKPAIYADRAFRGSTAVATAGAALDKQRIEHDMFARQWFFGLNALQQPVCGLLADHRSRLPNCGQRGINKAPELDFIKPYECHLLWHTHLPR